ncbi:Malic enzyme [Phytophthora pseudosyringae]|uniref:Malic enzyme n=1 Tax=Phytophthora pseudosyringae TaxID=221518 RepID=A0A8T1W0L7_9STRA|nr:Malic enzyme [Phytophthora pseudosyringae]
MLGVFNVAHDFPYNERTGFPRVERVERDGHGLRGLMPPRRLREEEQLAKMYDIFSKEEEPAPYVGVYKSRSFTTAS